ncbi:hypothetical protein [Methanoregula sp.]|uniref:hypothetical protein n=1 Tax=Methanoregula sp. TaxID=2052170 RepID=UPI002369306A|nr:hypothetical protein [Methanoregula sp.]MDD1685602.1 hypothetical protein [Methanoregula sp.]
MERGYRTWGLLAALLTFACTVSAGCLLGMDSPASLSATIPPTETRVSPAPESTLATVMAADMAFQQADLPPDYILRDRSATAYAGIDKIFRDLGWRQGYRVSFYRLDKDRDDMTLITQDIGIYPPETVKEVYFLEKDRRCPPEDNATDYQVPFPQQGDRSMAWRTTRSGSYGTIVTYTVIFTKKNVYEQITLSGTSTDYEILKSLAQTAADRIQ